MVDTQNAAAVAYLDPGEVNPPQQQHRPELGVNPPTQQHLHWGVNPPTQQHLNLEISRMTATRPSTDLPVIQQGMVR